MSLQELSLPEQDIVRQCLIAIARGPFIDEWEFQTRLGVQRDKVLSMLDLWPSINDGPDDCEETLAINNCLNEICYGLDIPISDWSHWFTVSRDDLEKVYTVWVTKRGWKRTGIK